MIEQLIIQFLGFIGLFFLIVSFQKDKRSFTLVSQLISALFFTIHFFFLNALSGAAMNLISIGRAYMFNLKESKKCLNTKILMYLFIILYWIAALITWQDWFSILPPISMTFSCLSLWSKKTKNIRFLFLLGRPPWIIYDFLTGSYAGLATEGFLILSLVFAIIRFDVLKKKINN